MASSSNINIVHESDAQRQFVRVRLPADIAFSIGAERISRRLLDVSSGGFSFDQGDRAFTVGDHFRGVINVTIDGIGFVIPVHFDIRSISATTRRVACVFQDIGPKEAAALRLLITAFAGGELTTAGDMLATLSRDNMVKSRSGRGGGLGIGGKLRALIGTLIALAVGLVAFGYSANKLYEIVFVTHAAAAKVAAPTYTITMPRDGTWFSLVKAGDVLKKGQPLGSFQAALLDVVEGVPGSYQMTPEQLGEIVGQQLKGSIASPCDCVVQKTYATDSQYILRNQSVLQLVEQDAQPYVLARFHYDQLKKIRVGQVVYFRVDGEPQRVAGTIVERRVLPAQTIDANGLNDLNGLNTNAAITDVIAVIEPSQPLAMARIDQPVEVLIDPLFDSYR